jgi:hypothetical protein
MSTTDNKQLAQYGLDAGMRVVVSGINGVLSSDVAADAPQGFAYNVKPSPILANFFVWIFRRNAGQPSRVCRAARRRRSG